MSTTTRPLPDLIPLAAFGPITFARIDGVFAIHDDGRLLYHSSLEAWPETPEARAAAIDAEIAEAEARLAALQGQKASLRPSALLLPGPGGDTPTGKRRAIRVRCKACGREITEGFFRRHVERGHPGKEPDDLRMDVDAQWPVLLPTIPVGRAEPPAEPAGQAGGN